MSLPHTITAVLMLLAATQISAATVNFDRNTEKYPNTANINIMEPIDFYDTRSALNDACGETFPIEDFADSGLIMNSFVTCASPVNSSNANCFPMGVLIPGFSVSEEGGKTNMIFMAAAGVFGLPSDAIGSNSINESTNISFDSPVTSVAFDLYTTSGATSDIQVDLLDAVGGVIGTNTFPGVSTTATFVGFISDNPIRGVKIKSQTFGKHEFINNLSFGTCTNVASDIPTMGQWSIFILGLILTSLALVFIRIQSLSIR